MVSDDMSTLNLTRDAIHLGGAESALPVPAFNHGYEAYAKAFCTLEHPGRLVAIYTTSEDWAVWEMHPAGDEVVIVTAGRAEFLQDIDGTIVRTVVGPNEAVINPAGVAHTANVIEPFTAVYITPGPGTEHRPR